MLLTNYKNEILKVYQIPSNILIIKYLKTNKVGKRVDETYFSSTHYFNKLV